MRKNHEIAIRITNTERGFVVTVTVENKETHKTAEKKDTFSELPNDFESLIIRAIEECDK
jgi:hypothetical protein